jgi:F-type H+-transporting ATPase subunit gamma
MAAFSLQYIKNRIRSIENTRKITGAMEMISVSKLNRIQSLFSASQRYYREIGGLVSEVAAGLGDRLDHPLCEQRPQSRVSAVCVYTSDSGLCGTYNNAVVREAHEHIRVRGADNVRVIVIGRRGFTSLKRHGIEINAYFSAQNGRYTEALRGRVLGAMTGLFLSGEVSSVHCAYTHFVSALHQPVVIEKLLPIECSPGGTIPVAYRFEPSEADALGLLIPRYLSASVSFMLLSSFTAEHAARALAMRAATDNAKELLYSLLITRNKLRQSRITQDMLEIISTSEALKG